MVKTRVYILPTDTNVVGMKDWHMPSSRTPSRKNRRYLIFPSCFSLVSRATLSHDNAHIRHGVPYKFSIFRQKLVFKTFFFFSVRSSSAHQKSTDIRSVDIQWGTVGVTSTTLFVRIHYTEVPPRRDQRQCPVREWRISRSDGRKNSKQS